MGIKKKLIGVVGKKRSGKDTIADYLIKNNGYQRYSFADPIKRGIMEMFGFTEVQMWGSTEDKETVDQRWGISPRRMLQIVGTELFQFDIQKHLNEGEFPVGRAVWVERFKLWYQDEKESHIREFLSAKKAGIINGEPEFNIVIADLRFPHEAKAIREMGGEIWRVDRPSLISEDMHASEKEQESIVSDHTIINNGTLDELFNKTNLILEKDLQHIK